MNRANIYFQREVTRITYITIREIILRIFNMNLNHDFNQMTGFNQGIQSEYKRIICNFF